MREDAEHMQNSPEGNGRYHGLQHAGEEGTEWRRTQRQVVRDLNSKRLEMRGVVHHKTTFLAVPFLDPCMAQKTGVWGWCSGGPSLGRGFMGGVLVGCMVMVISGIRAARKAGRQHSATRRSRVPIWISPLLYSTTKIILTVKFAGVQRSLLRKDLDHVPEEEIIKQLVLQMPKGRHYFGFDLRCGRTINGPHPSAFNHFCCLEGHLVMLITQLPYPPLTKFKVAIIRQLLYSTSSDK